MVLTGRIDQLKYLYEKLSKITSNIIVYRGGLKKYDELNFNVKENNENKKKIIVYDYVDDSFSMIRNMFLKRKKAYEKVGYEIIENNCQMTL